MFNAHVKVLNDSEINEEMESIKVAREGIEIMNPKAQFFIIKLEQVPIKDAIILKQESLSCGCDAALAWNVVSLKTEFTDALVFGSGKELGTLSQKMRKQPFNGKKIGAEIEEAIFNFKRREYQFPTKSGVLRIPPRKVMGILNITPDSFSDGGKYNTIDLAVKRAKEIEREGADILDIGAESTRPNSNPVSLEEEMDRLMPVLEPIKDAISIPISIDTYKWQVAEKALKLGADMINDVYGLKDESMIKVIKDFGAGAVIMHMKGTPQTMQDNPHYDSLISEILRFLRERSANAVSKGIEPEKIIIDPGIGFGKSVENNLSILNKLREFKSLGYPVLVGTSRKGFIGKITGDPVDMRVVGSLTTALIALQNGASMIRVHDVKETKELVSIFEAVTGDKNYED
ncbi:MAG: dihydropteroate synthase [Thermoplasmata archaeon]